jgi:hypothetical protein
LTPEGVFLADLSKLRNKIKPVIAATGSTVLMAGLLTSCFPTGNLLPPPFDLMEHDEGAQSVDAVISGNLMAPDVQEFFDVPIPPKDGVGATDEGVPPSDEAEPNPEPK